MIWKALSDPTRRSILVVLNQSPLTTGELSSKFDHLSRFAIMKHLGILEKADLIIRKKEGKFRWNYLNTAPFRQTYEDWLSQLVKLRKFAVPSSEAMGEADQQVQITSVKISLLIKASKLRVWNALTQQTRLWWLQSFFTHPKTKEMILEAKLGGMLYEDIGEKQGIVWANVIALQIPQLIELKGYLRPVPGGPAISFLRIELSEEEAHTRLTITDEVLGKMEKEQQLMLEARWTQLFKDGLKRFVEQN